MALATGGGGRFCQGQALVARSSQRSGDPLQVLPPLPSPLPEAGVLRRERNLVTLPYCCTHVRTLGPALRAGTGPHGWGAENAGKIGGCSGGRAAQPSLSSGTFKEASAVAEKVSEIR
jgi:hypothetical protein